MPYGLLADGVVLLHFLFIVFVVAGGLLALRWRWMPWLHLPAAGWGALVETMGWMCPLTPLEWRLRDAAGEAGYTTSFIEHWLMPLIYPPGLTRETQVILGLAVVVVNLAAYVWVWRRRIRSRG